MKKIIVLVLILVLIGVAILAAIGTVRDSNQEANKAKTYMSYAESQIELGGYGSAIDYIKAAIKVEPTAERYHRLAQVYLMAENSRAYIDVLEQMMSAYPKEQAAYKDLADYYYTHGSMDDCATVLRAASKAGVLDNDMREQFYAAAYKPTVISAPFRQTHFFYNKYALVNVEEEATYVDDSMHGCIGQYEDAKSGTATVMAVRQEGKWFFVDTTSLAYVKTKEALLDAWSYSNNLALVKTEEGYYFYNTHGTAALGPYEDASCFYDGIAAVKKNGVWQLINNAGAVIGDGKFEAVLMNEDRICSCGGVFFASTGSGYDMYDSNGKLIAATGFEDADIFYFENYAAVKRGGKWGFVDKTGNLIIEAKYSGARSFGCGVGAVCNAAGQWGFVTAKDRLVIDYQFLDAKTFGKNSCAPVKLETGWVYINIVG